MMRVANKRVYRRAKDFIEDDSLIRFPYLYVILDCRQETPTIMIEDYKEVPSSLEEVVAVITFSINMAMESKGWKMKLMKQGGELSPIPFSLRSVMEPLLDKPRTIEEFHGVDNMCELFKKKKKVPDFRDAIIDKEKASKIIAILHEMIDGCTQAKDVVRPIRAAIAAGLMRCPTWTEFHKEFPNAICSKSSLERLKKEDNSSYVGCELFKSLVEKLSQI